jgi:hypothetical protein
MSKMNRRQSLKFLGVGSLGAGLVVTGCENKEGQSTNTGAHDHGGKNVEVSDRDKELLKDKFFTDHEFKTVRLLSDLIIPKDERSGSASDAGVPEFIDFMMLDQPSRQTSMRGGIAWLHNRSLKLYGKDFLECTDEQRTAILDDIAWPAKAKSKPEISQGVNFFNSFRDLTATGFWTSKIGIQDLEYKGNIPVGKWEGCPDDACQKLGVSYVV